MKKKLQLLVDRIEREQYENKLSLYSRMRINTVPKKVRWWFEIHKKFAYINHNGNCSDADGNYYGESGSLMVELSTGNIYGIKSYGKVHRGRQYGTLDTISQYYWGNYYPILSTQFKR